MGKSLVIVESPGKVHTINEILGSTFVVKSSVGHIRDLPSGHSQSHDKVPGASKATKISRDDRLYNRMGINPEHGWNPVYEVLPGKEKIVQGLREASEKADYVYLATDLDREGEAIAWHLKEVLGLPDSKVRRVVFNEITKKAVLEAFKHPGVVNMDMVNAQQTRRFLDRVVGFMVSPLLWEKVGRGLSAGRVQSVAVRLVVEKEKNIKAFVPQEYWNVYAEVACHQDDEQVRLEVREYSGKEFLPSSATEIKQHEASLRKEKFIVGAVQSREQKSQPPAPFTTSTLQQSASTRLGFSVKKTMALAQSLYEGGFITYMRTDSTHLSEDALNDIRGLIQRTDGADYLPAKPRFYASNSDAQNAHEAIRPTSSGRTGEMMHGVVADAVRLYELIRERAVASQMTDAIFVNTDVTVNAGKYELGVKGRVVKFAGWTKVGKPPKAVILPVLKTGDELSLTDLESEQHFTRPEPRYTEATLVRELEKRGIGRPSTYATIISTIQDRGYVKLDQRRFFAEKMGEIVTSRLKQSFADLMDYDFTRGMENQLDEIADNRLNWLDCLDKFYNKFKIELDKAREPKENNGMDNNTSIVTTIMCPDCGHPMVIKNASTGVFLACSNYNGGRSKKAGSCRKTINLVPEDELPMFQDEDSESRFLRSKKRCPLCGAIMDSYILDEKHRMHICANNPDCPGYVIEEGNFHIKGADGPTITCERCGSPMVLKTGRFGSYMACTNEECGNTRKILKSGEIAPPRERPVDLPELICQDGKSFYVLRDGAAGIFLASSAFPKVRETRAPLVEELKRFRDRLPAKFLYLADAPVADENGCPTVVRFSRKTKQQYIMAEQDGKSTGFLMWYKDGKWIKADPVKKTVSTGTKKATVKKSSAKTATKKKAAEKKE